LVAHVEAVHGVIDWVAMSNQYFVTMYCYAIPINLYLHPIKVTNNLCIK